MSSAEEEVGCTAPGFLWGEPSARISGSLQCKVQFSRLRRLGFRVKRSDRSLLRVKPLFIGLSVTDMSFYIFALCQRRHMLGLQHPPLRTLGTISSGHRHPSWALVESQKGPGRPFVGRMDVAPLAGLCSPVIDRSRRRSIPS